MCELTTMLTMGATALSTALNVTQQLQQAGQQRGQYDWLAAQQRNEAAVAESQARMAEQQGEARAEAARRDAALRAGRQQARFAAQGTDLSGSPLDLLADTAAQGEESALSLAYEDMRDAWEMRNRSAARMAQARYFETQSGNVDPALGIVRSLLS